MGKERLAAFSDGVIAIIITIMVLELKVPHGADLAALTPVAPHIGIYWNNHHHMLHTVQHVDGLILWANAHLLFWLSLVPAATAWLGENFLMPLPAALYGVTLLMPAIAYYLLQFAITHRQGKDSVLRRAIGADIKGKISPLLYLAAVAIAFISPAASLALDALVALMWLVPDRRIENAVGRA
jgi:uncharacterized membrane protein